MATASASSGVLAAHVETERPLKGSKILQLGFLDGTRSESFLVVERAFSRSQFSPSMRIQNIWGWELDGLRAGHGMFILFPQSFSCPRKPLIFESCGAKKVIHRVTKARFVLQDWKSRDHLGCWAYLESKGTSRVVQHLERKEYPQSVPGLFRDTTKTFCISQHQKLTSCDTSTFFDLGKHWFDWLICG